MTSYFWLIAIHFWQKILAIKSPLDLILAPSKGGMRCVHKHMTRSQLQLKRARCKISNKGYLSLNIFVILCHNKLDIPHVPDSNSGHPTSPATSIFYDYWSIPRYLSIWLEEDPGFPQQDKIRGPTTRRWYDENGKTTYASGDTVPFIQSIPISRAVR